MDGAVDAKTVEIPYSGGYSAKFFYDEQTGEYKRSQNNTELIDYTSKERITTHNIIVYNVKYTTIDFSHYNKSFGLFPLYNLHCHRLYKIYSQELYNSFRRRSAIC